VKQIDKSISELYKNVNTLISQFSKTCIETKYRLFKSFCMSVYGSPLWNFEDRHCNKFYVAWRKCIRRLLSLPRLTHSKLLCLICEDLPVDLQLHLRFIKFVNSCKKSTNSIVNMLCNSGLCNPLSNMCNSLSHICMLYGLSRFDSTLDLAWVKRNYLHSINESDMHKACFIGDLISLDDKDENIDDIINYLCTD
jgi:hypothetical protein